MIQAKARVAAARVSNRAELADLRPWTLRSDVRSLAKGARLLTADAAVAMTMTMSMTTTTNKS